MGAHKKSPYSNLVCRLFIFFTVLLLFGTTHGKCTAFHQQEPIRYRPEAYLLFIRAGDSGRFIGCNVSNGGYVFTDKQKFCARFVVAEGTDNGPGTAVVRIVARSGLRTISVSKPYRSRKSFEIDSTSEMGLDRSGQWS